MENFQLRLDDPGRELISRGNLLRAGGNRIPWLKTHALLFDHYLVLARIINVTSSES